jgi:hypothetical protein
MLSQDRLVIYLGRDPGRDSAGGGQAGVAATQKEQP